MLTCYKEARGSGALSIHSGKLFQQNIFTPSLLLRLQKRNVCVYLWLLNVSFSNMFDRSSDIRIGAGKFFPLFRVYNSVHTHTHFIFLEVVNIP